MNALLDKLKQLPRAAKWLLALVAVLVVYFGVVEPTLEATNAARARADMLADGLAKEQALTSTDSDQGRILENGRRSFGEPFLPDDPANRPETLHTRVDAILEARGVPSRTKTERRVRLNADEAAKLVGPVAMTSGVERLILDISFEASPETVSQILADLEQAREVAAVSRVDLRRPEASGRGSSATGGRVLKATISAEAWVLSRASSGPLAGVTR